MFSRRLKTGYFIVEGLNSFAVVYFFYYFYFFMQQAFGYGNKANLALAALNGGTYALFALWGGKFAQRFGYFTALKLGFLIMLGALLVGSRVTSAPGEILVMVVTAIGMCFTWPTLEALVSEGEERHGLQQMVGVYNVIWAGTAALANFLGGAMLQKFGLHSLFYVPAAIQVVQLGLTFWLESQARQPMAAPKRALLLPAGERAPAPDAALSSAAAAAPLPPHPMAEAKQFVRMAWLANPCAYIAINTLIAVIPGLSQQLRLSTMVAGFCCSAWCFARLASFFFLWRWSGWHYRFRWLLFSFVALAGSFTLILLVPSVAVLILAQIVFGVAVGLIYYSSLFYSMDMSDTKGEHGGIHEAAIGLGNCAGPAVGALALQFVPQYANSSAVAVALLLLCGLGGLVMIRRLGGAISSSRADLAIHHETV